MSIDAAKFPSEDSAPTAVWPRPTEPQITICCAGLDRDTVRPLASLLTERGFEVDVFDDADTKPYRFNDYIERYGTHGLFVFCMTENLERGEVLELQRLAETARLPKSGQFVTNLDSQKTESIASIIGTVYEPLTDGNGVWVGPQGAAAQASAPSPGPSEDAEPSSDPEPDEAATQGAFMVFISRFGLVIGIVTIALAIVAIAVVLLINQGWLESSDAPTPESESAAASVASAANPVSGDRSAPAAAAPAPAEPEEPAAEPPPAEPAAAKPQKPTTAAAGGDDGEEQPPEENEQLEPDEPSPAVPSTKQIRNAVRKRKIRVLDNLLVARLRLRRASFTFKKASKYCDEREVAGISGWRLPTIGELRTMNVSRIVKRGIYWSLTEADSLGVSHFVLNADRRRISAPRSRWARGKPICVINLDDAETAGR